MRPPVLVGIVIAAVALLVWVFAPRALDSHSRIAAARAKADLAERKLLQFDPRVAALRSRMDPAALKSADFAAAAEAAKDNLTRVGSELGTRVGELARRSEAAHLKAPETTTVGASPESAKRAVEGFAELVKANEELLSAAIEQAHAAAQDSGGEPILHVDDAEGMTQRAKATLLLSEAADERRLQGEAQSRLLAVATEWRTANGYKDHYNGLEVSQVLSGLRRDLDELAKLHAEADEAVEKLGREVAERQAAVQEVDAALQKAGDALRAVEEKSFKAGDDQSFEAYRKEYERLTAEQGKLQQREQELKYGGRSGAQIAGDDLDTGELSGGEDVTGLEELQRRLGVAQERAARFTDAHKSLEKQIADITAGGESAKAEARRYTEQVSKLHNDAEKIVEEIKQHAIAAQKKENEALAAAKAAASAFSKAGEAANRWMSEARDEQSNRDPNRQNNRLTKMTGDKYMAQWAPSAEANARLLAGRVYAQIISAESRLIDDMRVYTSIDSELKFDPTDFRDHIATATDEGTKTLEAAVRIFQNLGTSGPAETSWVHNAALAATDHLLAYVQSSNAEAHLRDAQKAIQDAVAKREASPFVATYVQFAQHLSSGGPASKPATPEGESGEPAPAEAPAGG